MLESCANSLCFDMNWHDVIHTRACWVHRSNHHRHYMTEYSATTMPFIAEALYTQLAHHSIQCACVELSRLAQRSVVCCMLIRFERREQSLKSR